MLDCFTGGRCTVINVDAHLDVRPMKMGLEHSGSPFRRLLENERFIDSTAGNRFVEFAAQGSQCSAEHAQFVTKRCGPNSIVWLTRDIRSRHMSADAVFEKRLSQAVRSNLFVSFDLDSVCAADAPGVSCPGTVGLSAAEAMAMCRLAGRQPGIKLMDLSEFNPLIEDYNTGRLCVNMFYSFLVGLAQQRHMVIQPVVVAAPATHVGRKRKLFTASPSGASLLTSGGDVLHIAHQGQDHGQDHSQDQDRNQDPNQDQAHEQQRRRRRWQRYRLTVRGTSALKRAAWTTEEMTLVRLSQHPLHEVQKINKSDGAAATQLNCKLCQYSVKTDKRTRHLGWRTSRMCSVCRVPLCVVDRGGVDAFKGKSCFNLWHTQHHLPSASQVNSRVLQFVRESGSSNSVA
eukprot:TRINITY_DN66541_c3_g1_i1.p1 TRINITY_DN66541_c3_g1~~TRINITY_DN66541_c3_g1_i1.p1  ORF type:complete len:401 (-),score=142.49 TRINITY_DN66541_c3_g1_i1:81-1283(-)